MGEEGARAPRMHARPSPQLQVYAGVEEKYFVSGQEGWRVRRPRSTVREANDPALRPRSDTMNMRSRSSYAACALAVGYEQR